MCQSQLNGARPSPTPGSLRPSSTASPSTPTSSTPAPTPTASAPPGPAGREPPHDPPDAGPHRPDPTQKTEGGAKSDQHGGDQMGLSFSDPCTAPGSSRSGRPLSSTTAWVG